MKVLIIGASGFIGLPISQALVRAGHIVYGVTRSDSKVRTLAAEEIIPIVAPIDNPSIWLPMVATLDVVIEAISGEVNVLSEKLLAAVTEAVKQYRPPHAPKLAYIYTSGSWVHGENRKDVISDTTPITQSVDLVAWRPTLEQKVVTNPVLNGIVIRPALLYGRSASILGMLFKTADEGKVKWFGAPGGRYALIHQDDLGELYRLAAEKSAIVGGLLFDAANDFTESVDDVLQKLVEVSGAQGYEYIQPTNLFEKAITTTLLLRPYLARSLLGWQPRKAGLVDHLEIYYNAWKATAGSATVSSDFIR
ncbi:NAD(P)-binding protein [Fomitopsis serialis]|uniref:NAD(P)-binding protein n=1 Tax=Fomitopsis serialis TaxID=139415 RepID=UPI002008A449|nr:NAD(P)-binding protein [Neoantrodia serialis]KAH9936188.1 NAD(P)-binding protein [Neoantrodia serialis]